MGALALGMQLLPLLSRWCLSPRTEKPGSDGDRYRAPGAGYEEVSMQ
jgi:hypothetical protein